MTTAEWLMLILYVGMTVALGYGVLAAAGLRDAGGWPAAYLAGQLCWLVLYLLGGWLNLPVTGMVWAAGCAALGVAAVYLARRRCRPSPEVWRHTLLLAAVLAGCFPQLIYQALYAPLVDWDARSIWFFHGKAIWYSGGIRAAHFADPRYALNHPYYPMLIPVQAAVLGVLNGRWSEMAVKPFLLLNAAAYFGLLATVLRRRGASTLQAWGATALIGGVAASAYVNGYADNHYALPLALAAFILFAAPPERPTLTQQAPVALLLCAFALNVKNEAAWYAGLIILAGWLCHRRRLRWLVMARQLAPGVIPFLLWAAFKAAHGIDHDLGLTRHLSHPATALAQVIERIPVIRAAMGAVHTGLWTAAVAGLWVLLAVIAGRSATTDADRRLLTAHDQRLWALFFAIHGLLFVIYGLTPYAVRWHLNTSLDRLLLFPFLVLVMLVARAAERVLGIYPEIR